MTHNENNKQLKRRIRGASLLRLASAILIEIGDQRDAGKRDLKMDD